MAMSSIHTLYASSFRFCFPNSSAFEASKLSPQFKPLRGTKHYIPRETTRARATLDDVEFETDQFSSTTSYENEKAKKDVEESVRVLKDAAKTRKVAAEEVLSALSIIEKAKLDPSGFFETLGGKESPGRTWMLIFTAEKQLNGGRYFPLTAVQRFDASVFQLSVWPFEWKELFNNGRKKRGFQNSRKERFSTWSSSSNIIALVKLNSILQNVAFKEILLSFW